MEVEEEVVVEVTSEEEIVVATEVDQEAIRITTHRGDHRQQVDKVVIKIRFQVAGRKQQEGFTSNEEGEGAFNREVVVAISSNKTHTNNNKVKEAVDKVDGVEDEVVTEPNKIPSDKRLVEVASLTRKVASLKEETLIRANTYFSSYRRVS